MYPHPMSRSIRTTKKSPLLAQEVTTLVRQPSLAEIATAIQTLQKSVQALSQQLDSVEYNTAHNVNEYINTCANVISNSINSGFNDVRSDRQWVHTTILQAYNNLMRAGSSS
jgi:hypothetical protein